MSERRGMEVGDWFNAAVNLAIGVLLGSVVYRLVQLVASGSWLMALIMIFLGAGLFLFMVLSDKLFDLFSGVRFRPAKNPKPQPPKPLLRILSLPSGFIVGVVLAVAGLDTAILDMLP